MKSFFSLVVIFLAAVAVHKMAQFVRHIQINNETEKEKE
jgi:hypothetical protein